MIVKNIGLVGMVYLLFAFYNVTFDFAKWHADGRFMFVMCTVVVVVLHSLLQDLFIPSQDADKRRRGRPRY